MLDAKEAKALAAQYQAIAAQSNVDAARKFAEHIEPHIRKAAAAGKSKVEVLDHRILFDAVEPALIALGYQATYEQRGAIIISW
ncbi:TPA: hypothetical protein ACOECQ_001104 [Stenotrophomonas maltophilia]